MKALLLLPFTLLPLARLDATTEACATVEKDIVTTAVEAGSFKTLAAALQAGELVGALQGEGPFTVFAPTDAAFAALPEGTLESLLKPENKGKLQLSRKAVLQDRGVGGGGGGGKKNYGAGKQKRREEQSSNPSPSQMSDDEVDAIAKALEEVKDL